ncbi:MAG TPA: ATP-binding cassette domain-containing protein, partial [Bacteroidia bacterium]|nr:ATP-binding cassette domain-containing protein [Bacteroidia bacterium]
GFTKKMEVGEQALYLARLKGMSRSDAMTELRYWFEKFELKGWWKKKIEELSKGMAQKVQFITTVIHKPRLLILDEPFTGFDPINANLIKDELLEMKSKGVSIVLSTHRMESVEELCTHIALINKSKVVLNGSVKEVRKDFKSNIYEIHYAGNNISLANSLWAGFELISNVKHEDENIATVKLIDDATPNQLLHALIDNIEIHLFREVTPTMSDIFIKAVNNS